MKDPNYNGYLVRLKSDKPWETPEESENASVCVRVINTVSGTTKTFASLREIERELGISRFITKKRVYSVEAYNGYKFKEVRSDLGEILD